MLNSRDSIPEISERLRNQNNRCTAHPMFCAQKWKSDTRRPPGKWVTLMVAFTEKGCQEFLEAVAPKEKTRIAVESFAGCPEMEIIRETILNWHKIQNEITDTQEKITWLEERLHQENSAKESYQKKIKEIKTSEKQARMLAERLGKEKMAAVEGLKTISETGRNTREGKTAQKVLESLK